MSNTFKTSTSSVNPTSVTLNNPGATVGGITGSGITNGYSYTIGAGSAYSTLTTSGMNGTTSWAPPNQNFVANNGKPIMTVPHNEQTVILEKDATLDVKGTVRINGIDLEERLNVIEKVLQIPSRDAIMESKHPKLKALYEQYMHELEKYKTWNRLNGDENGTT